MTVEALAPYLPDAALEACHGLIRKHRVLLKIVKKRVTRHGDYRKLPDGSHRITVNSSDNPYRFLLTLIHEIAHLVAFEEYGRKIKPHGKEWKYTFTCLMVPFIRPEVLPHDLLPVFAAHFKNPKASSSTDLKLVLALNNYNPPSEKHLVSEIPEGGTFKLYNGKVFRKGKRRVKRIECQEIKTGRVYLFQPHAEVDLMK